MEAFLMLFHRMFLLYLENEQGTCVKWTHIWAEASGNVESNQPPPPHLHQSRDSFPPPSHPETNQRPSFHLMTAPSAALPADVCVPQLPFFL